MRRGRISTSLQGPARQAGTPLTYGIAVQQLGDFLRAQAMPTDPAKVTRAHVIDWMRFLQRPGADGGQGLAAQTALQRFRSVSRLFAWMVDTDEIRESPIARMKPPRVPEELVPVIVELGRDADPGYCASCGRHAAPWLTATALLRPRSARSKRMIATRRDTGYRLSEVARHMRSAADADWLQNGEAVAIVPSKQDTRG
ncbi:MAG: hypothetical protein KC495_03150 [Dehalococcoidia bacterium]|nr:hypothetical protein [Dehalococcoidia bacterium]